MSTRDPFLILEKFLNYMPCKLFLVNINNGKLHFRLGYLCLFFAQNIFAIYINCLIRITLQKKSHTLSKKPLIRQRRKQEKDSIDRQTKLFFDH